MMIGLLDLGNLSKILCRVLQKFTLETIKKYGTIKVICLLFKNEKNYFCSITTITQYCKFS